VFTWRGLSWSEDCDEVLPTKRQNSAPPGDVQYVGGASPRFHRLILNAPKSVIPAGNGALDVLLRDCQAHGSTPAGAAQEQKDINRDVKTLNGEERDINQDHRDIRQDRKDIHEDRQDD